MKMEKASFEGFDSNDMAWFKSNNGDFSCKEKLVVDSGIIPESLKLGNKMVLEMTNNNKEVTRVRLAPNSNNFYIEFYKHDRYKWLPFVKEKKFENKHLKGIPKPEFKGDYMDLVPALGKRQLIQAEAVCECIHQAKFEPAWHLALGLGIPSIFETSINLHPLYGFPYINGSSLKGAVRAWVIGEYFDNNEGLAIGNPDFCALFGCPKSLTVTLVDEEGNEGKPQQYNSHDGKDRAGSLLFFDALPQPEKKKNIEVVEDILNPHFPDYYKDGVVPPADWQSPIPVNFLVVKKTPFQFIVGLRKGKENRPISVGHAAKKLEGSVLDVVGEMLKNALTENGIGAKTSVGYGYMK